MPLFIHLHAPYQQRPCSRCCVVCALLVVVFVVDLLSVYQILRVCIRLPPVSSPSPTCTRGLVHQSNVIVVAFCHHKTTRRVHSRADLDDHLREIRGVPFCADASAGVQTLHVLHNHCSSEHARLSRSRVLPAPVTIHLLLERFHVRSAAEFDLTHCNCAIDADNIMLVTFKVP